MATAGAVPLSALDVMLGSVENSTAVSPVFVGRTGELGRLTEALARATAGEPQALLVGGEAGVGKTRLLQEFLARARESGAVTAVGGCLELGADGLPFAPFATALRGLHRALGGAELASALAGHEAELARLLPDLAPPEAASEHGTRRIHDEADGRARLFELTAQLLEGLATERTVVVAIEDLHWADRSTRELLGYLYRSVQTSRLVVLATYRADDIHRRHPLRPFLAEHDRLRTVRRIEVPRLSQDEVAAQMAGIQGVPEAEAALVETVFGRTHGNPFFVEELTQNCATCGISDSLRDLLLVRIEALPEEAQRVVRIAAQAGSAVEHALLEAVCELPEEELLEALRAAVGANVLLPTEDGTGYGFRHALLREAVGDDLLPGEGAALNRRFARTLEARPDLVAAEARAARLAHYWYHGRDAVKALPAVLAASVEARLRHAFAEQHQLLERAIELWDEVPREERAKLRPIDHAGVYPACASGVDEDALRFLDLLAEAVIAARTGGDMERALAVAKRALHRLDEVADPLRAAWFLVQCSRLTESLGRGDGWEEIGRAQELVRGLPPSAVHAEILAAAAAWGMLHRSGPTALSTAVRAVELARVVGATTTELEARITLGVLMIDSGDHDAGLTEMATAREHALERGEHGVSLRAEVNTAAVHGTLGRVSEALFAGQRAERSAAEHGRPNLRAFALAHQAEARLALGEWAEAEALAGEARKYARGAETRGWINLFTAELALRRGDLAALRSAVPRAQEFFGGRTAQPQHRIPLRHLAMALAAEQGDFATARAELDSALKEGFPPGMHRYAWPLLYSGVMYESRVRGLPAAEDGRAGVLERLHEAARRTPHPAPLWEAYSRLVRAEFARAEGRDDPGKWAEAAGAFEGKEHPCVLAQARLRWAEALLTTTAASGGERERAAWLLREAHAAAVRMTAAPLAEECEQLAGRARIPLGSDGSDGSAGRAAGAELGEAVAAGADPADSFGLTQRERDVLALVADGHSNRRIAEELFISPKTASVHVSNILTKLEVSGRGEAAAMAHRLRLVPPHPLPHPPRDEGAREGSRAAAR